MQDPWKPAILSMLMLITLLNDGTLIAIGYDNVVPQDTPTVWNLRVLFFVGIVFLNPNQKKEHFIIRY